MFKIKFRFLLLLTLLVSAIVSVRADYPKDMDCLMWIEGTSLVHDKRGIILENVSDFDVNAFGRIIATSTETGDVFLTKLTDDQRQVVTSISFEEGETVSQPSISESDDWVDTFIVLVSNTEESDIEAIGTDQGNNVFYTSIEKGVFTSPSLTNEGWLWIEHGEVYSYHTPTGILANEAIWTAPHTIAAIFDGKITVYKENAGTYEVLKTLDSATGPFFDIERTNEGFVALTTEEYMNEITHKAVFFDPFGRELSGLIFTDHKEKRHVHAAPC